ncbi:MAG TPA: ATP-binding cassette domain-containing protein, partial [Gammaproteobacteria bacterium]|nr:ATP-binding cassette domain-containing protein [Gammaproteobacteria bacterium]
GKSTLLKLMIGLLTPTAGRVLVDGEPPTRRRGWVGYVPHGLPVRRDFPLTVRQLVAQGRLQRWPGWPGPAARRRRREAVEAAIAQVELQPQAGASLGALSGGQLQRALLARALATEAPLLALDEPTSGLDARSQALLLAALDARRGRHTVLFVTHDVQLLTGRADRVLDVAAGRIQERATA